MEVAIVRKTFSFVALVLFASIGVAQAQNSSYLSAPAAATSVSRNSTAANQSVINALSSLPEADTLIYINPQRILSDVVPKFIPAKDVEEMMKGFEEVKKNFGVDPQHVEYIVVAVRFRKPTGDLKFQPPEALLVAGGDFSAESLIAIARMASSGQLRDEKYGSKTLGLMTIDPIAKEAEKNPFLKSFTEVGIAALSGNMIAVGTPGYLRAAVDAADGKDRISSETLNSLVRDSSALISVAGRPWNSFAKSFGMLGTETTNRDPRCLSKIGDFYAAVTMDASNFMLRGAMNEDNPDTAKIVSNLFSGLLGFAGSNLKDPAVQSMLKNIVIAAEGDEVTLRADFPQQMVKEMIQQQMKPKKDESAVSAPAVTKPTGRTVRKKTTRRRR
jgi:hypothetical protein